MGEGEGLSREKKFMALTILGFVGTEEMSGCRSLPKSEGVPSARRAGGPVVSWGLHAARGSG